MPGEGHEGSENSGYDGVIAGVKDAESKNQLSRLTSINEAWRKMLERRTIAADHGETQEGLRYYRAGVERMLFEIQSAAQRTNATEATEVWNEGELGTVRLPVPDEILEAYQSPGVRIVNQNREPEPVEVTITGLSDLFEQEWPLQRVWQLQVAGSRGRKDPITAASQREPSMSTLDEAVRNIRILLGEIDLDLDLGGDHRGIGGDDAL